MIFTESNPIPYKIIIFEGRLGSAMAISCLAFAWEAYQRGQNVTWCNYEMGQYELSRCWEEMERLVSG